MTHKWHFECVDNGGKRQSFTVSAKTKDEAIRKGFERAKRNAKGDISPNWSCKLMINF